jgi:hypothetical protein
VRGVDFEPRVREHNRDSVEIRIAIAEITGGASEKYAIRFADIRPRGIGTFVAGALVMRQP